MVVAEVAHPLLVATVQVRAVATVTIMVAVMVADLAEVPAHRTQVSRARTPATGNHSDNLQASHAQPMHRVSAMRSHRASTANNSARTRAARALTHVQTNATTLMSASPPAMCLQAFHHPACLPEAAVAVDVAVTVTGETSVVAAVRAQAVVEAGAVLAGSGVDSTGVNRKVNPAHPNQGMTLFVPYIFPGNQVAMPGKNQSSNTITHISRKNGSVTLAM